MQILISGGFGFTGGRLAQHLCSAGHRVLLGSRSPHPPPEWLREAKVVTMDWSDYDSLVAACNGVDVIIHAAGINAQESLAYPAAALAFNGVSTIQLLDAACKASVKRFLYLSTAHVYNSPLEGVITEDTPARNHHPYASSHLAGESAVLHATQYNQIEGIVLRLSNAFGCPAHGDANCWMLLVNDLCSQAVNLGSMTLRSAGLQRRDFIPLNDLSRVVTHMIGLHSDKICDGLFNVGCGESSRIIDMAELIQTRCMEVLGKSTQIVRPTPSESTINLNLHYRIDKLLSTGVDLKGDSISEIDATLRLCQRLNLGRIE